jgi:formate-dependent phosphoribosylglycinamide formyltransferase (GAR transformylase)
MKKALLVDTNVSSAPIYKYLDNAGYKVYVVGINDKDFLAKCASSYINLDYSNPELLSGLIDELEIDYLIPGCNDVSYKSCSLANKDNRFPGIDSISNVELLNNKKSFREFAFENSLPVPVLYSINNIDKIKFPVIVKPVDSFSGKGITVIYKNDPSQIKIAIKLAQEHSRNNDYLIEEFVNGKLYSHSAFIQDNKVLLDMVVEEHCIANQFAVDTSRIADKFPRKILESVRSMVTKLVKLLKLKDGLMHTQFILNEQSIWLIEPTRRCPGDLYSNLINLSTGLNYAENYVRSFLGLPYQFSSDTTLKDLIIRHTITEEVGGYFWALQSNEYFKLREFVALSLSGDLLEAAPISRVGLMFLGAETLDEFDDLYDKLITRKFYQTKNI